jgi:hypothetical protein
MTKLPYNLRKRIEHCKAKYGIEITIEMANESFIMNEKGNGGSTCGWEIFHSVFTIQQVSKLNKRDSQTIGDAAIDYGRFINN